MTLFSGENECISLCYSIHVDIYFFILWFFFINFHLFKILIINIFFLYFVISFFLLKFFLDFFTTFLFILSLKRHLYKFYLIFPQIVGFLYLIKLLFLLLLFFSKINPGNNFVIILGTFLIILCKVFLKYFIKSKLKLLKYSEKWKTLHFLKSRKLHNFFVIYLKI